MLSGPAAPVSSLQKFFAPLPVDSPLAVGQSGLTRCELGLFVANGVGINDHCGELCMAGPPSTRFRGIPTENTTADHWAERAGRGRLATTLSA
jgi:hypothetical protein